MATETIYDIAATRGHSFRREMAPIAGAPNDKFSAKTGDNVMVVESAGSLSISGAGGEPPAIDLSADLQDIKHADIDTETENGVLDQDFSWRPSLTDITIEHGAVAGGPFTIGETVTGGTSSSTGVVVGVGTGFLQTEASAVSTFEVGEVITGGSSSATATLTNPDNSVAAGASAELDERRFLRFVGKVGSTGALIANAVAIFFTYAVKGVGARLS